MTRQARSRQYGCLAIALAFVFFAVRSTYRVSRRAVRAYAKAPHDRVETNEARFAPARVHLPERGTIEYRCLDRDDKTDAVRDRYLAQYALTPLVLDPYHPHEWIVEDRPADMEKPHPPHPDDLELIFDAGNGIRVYRRTPP